MPLPQAVRRIKCDGCGAKIHPLLFRYLFLSMGWRGKPTQRPHKTEGFTLCGPCGDRALQALYPILPVSSMVQQAALS